MPMGSIDELVPMRECHLPYFSLHTTKDFACPDENSDYSEGLAGNAI